MNLKSIILTATAIIGLNLYTTAQSTDSVTTIIGAERVLVIDNSDGLKTIVTTSEDEKIYEHSYGPNSTVISHFSHTGFSFSGNRNRKESAIQWDVIAGGLGFGFCSAPGAPEAAGIEMGKSFELSWLKIMAVQAKNRYGNSFSLGVGINWRNYRTTLGNRFIVNDGQVDLDDYPAGSQALLSRIKIFSVQFPLLYHQKLPFGITKEKISFELGPIFNLNTHASVLSAWKDGSTDAEYKVNGINIRPFTIDLFAMLNLWSFGGIYARYTPYNALTGNNLVNFHQFSTGLMFFM